MATKKTVKKPAAKVAAPRRDYKVGARVVVIRHGAPTNGFIHDVGKDGKKYPEGVKTTPTGPFLIVRFKKLANGADDIGEFRPAKVSSRK